MIGQTLGHYRVLEKVGEGGMGVVYKAQDLHLDLPVALTVLPPEKVADADRKQRFTQEAKAASALNHPHIITIHDIASKGGVDFIAMEYVAGRPVDARSDGEPRSLVNQRYASLPGLAWTSDNRELVYAAGGVHNEYLRRVPVSGREPPRRVPDARPSVTAAPRT